MRRPTPRPHRLLRPYLSGLDGVGDGLEARSRRKRLEEEEEAKRLYEEAVGAVSREVSSEEVPAEMPDGMQATEKDLHRHIHR